MKRAALVCGLLALALSLWLPPVQYVLREYALVPLLELVWFVTLVFDSVPQGLVWGVLVLGAMLAFATSGSLRSSYVLPTTRPWTNHGGLLAPWARLVYQASRDEYARWRLAQRLAQLAQTVLGNSQPLSAVELRHYLASDQGGIPANVRSYLLAGLSTYTPSRRPFAGFTGFDMGDRRAGPLSLDPAEVVAFLEAQHERSSNPAHDVVKDTTR